MLRCRYAALLALFVLAAHGCVHLGQRFLRVRIEVDGKTTLTGSGGVRDDLPVEAMWAAIAGMPFRVEPDLAAAGSDTDVVHTWNGDIAVVIVHVERELARARVKSLTMRGGRGTWRFDAAEAARLAAAAGK